VLFEITGTAETKVIFHSVVETRERVESINPLGGARLFQMKPEGEDTRAAKDATLGAITNERHRLIDHSQQDIDVRTAKAGW